MMQKKQEIWVGLVVLIIGIFSFAYWGSQKQIWFCDEVYTYESANGFEQEWPSSYIDQWMTGEDVESYFAADSDKISLNDINVRLYNDHVPLYFWLFRLVSFFGFKGSGTIWIGLSINLFFYLIVLGLVYKGFCYLTKNVWVSGVVSFLTCISNRLVLEQATTIRMYMMLLCAELLLILAGLWVLRGLEQDKMSFGVFAYMFAVSVIGFLTHYDYWIFYAVTAMLFCLWLLISGFYRYKKTFWRSREFQYALAWVGNFGVSLWVTTILFPYCKWNLNRGKGKTALSSIFDFSSKKIEYISWGYQRLSASIFGESCHTILGLGVMFGCIIGGAIILYRRKERRKMIALVITVLIAQAYQLIVCFTLPDVKEERYLWGAFTLMMLCMVWGAILILNTLFARIKKVKIRRTAQVLVMVVLTISISIGELMVIDGGKGIAYLFQEAKDIPALRKHSEIPWIVYGPTVGVYSYYDWIIPEKICFLTQDNTSEDAIAVKELQEEDSFLLYIYEDFYPQALDFFEQTLAKDLTGEYLTRSTNLCVYLINKE